MDLHIFQKKKKVKYVYVRCNGLHGETKGVFHHSFFHIHTVSAEDLNNGIKVERNIQKTTEYAALEDAIQFYVRHINLKVADRVKHFPPPSGQIDLFG